jgi:hypothetical protein
MPKFLFKCRTSFVCEDRPFWAIQNIVSYKEISLIPEQNPADSLSCLRLRARLKLEQRLLRFRDGSGILVGSIVVWDFTGSHGLFSGPSDRYDPISRAYAGISRWDFVQGLGWHGVVVYHDPDPPFAITSLRFSMWCKKNWGLKAIDCLVWIWFYLLLSWC